MKRLLVLMQFVLLLSCSKTDLMQIKDPGKLTIAEVQDLLEAECVTYEIPEILINNRLTKTDDKFDYTIQWHMYNHYENDSVEIFEIPLKVECEMILKILSYEESGNYSETFGESAVMHSHLVIRRFKGDNKVSFFINTMIGNSSSNSSLSFLGDKSDFCGYQIFSSTEGKCLLGSYYYKNGIIQKMELYRCDMNDDLDNFDNGFIVHLCETGTKVFAPDNGLKGVCTSCGAFLFDERTCIICGEPVQWQDGDEGSSGSNTGPCPYCNMSPCICEPCPRCGYDPCVCVGPDEGCQYCYSVNCQGECRN